MRIAPLLLWACVAPTTSSTDDPATPLGAFDVPVSPPSRTVEIEVGADGAFTPDTLEVWPGDTVVWRFADAAGAVVQVDPEAAEPCASVGPASADDLTGPMPFAPGGVFGVDGAAPGLRGSVVTLRWSDVEPAPGVFDWSGLDRLASDAVAAGQLFSVALVAGAEGTPAWLGDEGVDLLQFGGPGDTCPAPVALGDPTDPAWQDRWFAVTTALGGHLRSRADWWRALAYVKLTGANTDGESAALPLACDPGCTCDPDVWRDHGATRAALVAFHEAQLDVLAAAFPGKATSFALVADGLPGGTATTDAILAAGAARGAGFAVQDNTSGTLEPRVVAAGEAGAFTGFRVGDEAALAQVWEETQAVFVEVTDPTAALAAWNEDLVARRSAHPEHPEAPQEHQWRVTGAPGTTLGFVDPARCVAVGRLTVR
jgi:hypothetical protein